MAKTKLTDAQLKEFRREYMVDEIDIVTLTMTADEKKDIFGTVDIAKIQKQLEDGISHIKTQEDLREDFSDKYVHIYEIQDE